MVLVDSTVWIDLLRGTHSPPATLLRALLQEGDAAVAPVIVQEVLQGRHRQARSLNSKHAFSDCRCSKLARARRLMPARLLCTRVAAGRA